MVLSVQVDKVSRMAPRILLTVAALSLQLRTPATEPATTAAHRKKLKNESQGSILLTVAAAPRPLPFLSCTRFLTSVTVVSLPDAHSICVST